MRKPIGEPSTGVPTDKAGLIKWLVEKGISLGFHAEANYISPENNTFAEAAWSLNPGQKPIFTFTVEETNPIKLAANALQWTGFSTEPKSWMHICVFPSGSAELLSSLLLPSSVPIYDAHGLARINDDLEEFTKRLVILLGQYIVDKPSSSLCETVKKLAVSTAAWPMGKQSTQISLRAQTEFSPECLFLFSAENGEDEEVEVPVLEPSRKVVPLEFSSGNSSFEGTLMRLIEAQGGSFLFSTEHRNYPFIFRLLATEGGGPSTLDLWFDVDKSNIPQVLEFWALVEAVKSSKAVSLLGPSGEAARLTLD